MRISPVLLFIALYVFFTSPALDAAEPKDDGPRGGEWEITMHSEGTSRGTVQKFTNVECFDDNEASSHLQSFIPNYRTKGKFESNNGECRMVFESDDGKSMMESVCKDGSSTRMEASYGSESYEVTMVGIRGSEKTVTKVTSRRIGECAKSLPQ